MTADQKIRLECLRLAVQQGIGFGDPVANARRMADFVLGTRDAAVIDAAVELAEKVRDATA